MGMMQGKSTAPAAAGVGGASASAIPFVYDAELEGEFVPNGIEPEQWRPMLGRRSTAFQEPAIRPRHSIEFAVPILRHFRLAHCILAAPDRVGPPAVRSIPIFPFRGDPASLRNHLTRHLATPSVRALVEAGGLLLFDSSGEFLPPAAFSAIQEALRACAIPGERAGCAIHQFRAVRAIAGSRVRMLHWHFAFAQCAMLWAGLLGDPARFVDPQAVTARRTPRDRIFLSLNGSLRSHRLLLVLHLLQAGHLDKGFVSCPAGDEPLFRGILSHGLELAGRDPAALALAGALPRLLSRLPLVVDRPLQLRGDVTELPRVDVDAYEEMTAAPYAESYLSIVTESDFGQGGKARLTEKICKPLANLHPFVLLGSPGMLAELRRSGFQTFEPLIDESYDSIADPWRRLQAAFRQIDALCAMPMHELDAWYRALLPRLQHNRIHLFRRGPRETFSLHRRIAGALAH
jgi:hypothetical protein